MVLLKIGDLKQTRIIRLAKISHKMDRVVRMNFRMELESAAILNKPAIRVGADRNRSWNSAVLNKLNVSGKIQTNESLTRGISPIETRMTINGRIRLIFGSDNQVRVT